MNKLKHIYQNELGWTTFIKYFQYLNNNKEKFSLSLFEFAREAGRYELRGEKTLHDAWLTDLHISKIYNGDLLTTNIEITLLHADHEKEIILKYFNVTHFNSLLNTNHGFRQPADLLVHEVQYLEPFKFKHSMEFAWDVWIDITF